MPWIVPVVAAAGALGSAASSSSSASAGRRQASKLTKRGIGELQAGQDAYGVDPNAQAGRDLVSRWLANPSTFDPALARATAADAATRGYMQNSNQFLEKAGAAGLARSGSTFAGQNRLAQGLGQTLSDSSRQIDLVASQERQQSYQAALNALAQQMNAQYSWYKDKANIYAGAATNPAWSQPSPLSNSLTGLGTILGQYAAGGGFGRREQYTGGMFSGDTGPAAADQLQREWGYPSGPSGSW